MNKYRLTMKPSNIDYRFKILYTIGIIIVATGHCDLPIKLLNDWFPYYSFNIALFVFASGYFYKPENENNVFKYILKKIKKLLIPLYLWNMVYGLFVYWTKQYGFNIGLDPTPYNLFIAPWFDGHQFQYNLGGWFITTLFTIEIFNILTRYIFRKLSITKWKYHEILYYLLFLGLGLYGTYLIIHSYHYLYILPYRCAYLLPFFALGFLYKNHLEKYDRKIPSIVYFAFIFTIQIIVSHHLGFIPSYSAANLDNFDYGIYVPIIVGYTGVAFWFRISQILTPIIGKNKYINTIADNAYSIMINQFFGFFLVKLLFSVIYPSTFNFNSFHNTLFWYFYPSRGKLIGLLYLVAGIVIPIYMQKGVNYIKARLIRRPNKPHPTPKTAPATKQPDWVI